MSSTQFHMKRGQKQNSNYSFIFTDINEYEEEGVRN